MVGALAPPVMRAAGCGWPLSVLTREQAAPGTGDLLYRLYGRLEGEPIRARPSWLRPPVHAGWPANRDERGSSWTGPKSVARLADDPAR